MNVLILFALLDILKCERLFSILNGKKGQKRVSHGKQVKIATLLKKVENIE